MKENNPEPLFTTIDYVALPIMLIFFVIAIWGWIVAVGRIRSGRSMIPLHRTSTPIGFVDLVVIFAAWISSQVFVVAGLFILVGFDAFKDPEGLMENHGVELLFLAGLGQLAVLAISAIYLMVRYKTATSFGFRFSHFGRQIQTGAIAFIMIFPIVLVVQWVLSRFVPYEHTVLEVLTKNPTPVSIGATWLAAVIAAPLAEEFFFRGVLHNWLERLSTTPLSDNGLFVGGQSHLQPIVTDRQNSLPQEQLAVEISPATQQGQNPSELSEDGTNPYLAPQQHQSPPETYTQSPTVVPAFWPIIVSSLFFAAVHIGQGLAPIPLFILAVGLGYVFRQTGSLLACLTMHFMLNFYSMLIFTIALLMGETL